MLLTGLKLRYTTWLQVGKLADLVLWKPAFFGAKPEMVIKGGTIAWADMGDPNASIPTPEPVILQITLHSLATLSSISNPHEEYSMLC